MITGNMLTKCVVCRYFCLALHLYSYNKIEICWNKTKSFKLYLLTDFKIFHMALVISLVTWKKKKFFSICNLQIWLSEVQLVTYSFLFVFWYPTWSSCRCLSFFISLPNQSRKLYLCIHWIPLPLLKTKPIMIMFNSVIKYFR